MIGPTAHAERQFIEAWKRLSALGKCDNLAGAEYRRVYREWVWYGCPTRDLEKFIQLHANVDANDPGN